MWPISDNDMALICFSIATTCCVQVHTLLLLPDPVVRLVGHLAGELEQHLAVYILHPACS